VYIPLGGNRERDGHGFGWLIRLLPVLVPFLFTFYVNGLTSDAMIYTCGNFLMVAFELFGVPFLRKSEYFGSIVSTEKS
jgi:hypothetical protein